jgi:hypothetical protein
MRSGNKIAAEPARTFREHRSVPGRQTTLRCNRERRSPFLIILVPKIFRLKVFLPCPAQPSHSIALKRNPGPLKQNFKPHFSYEPGEQIAREPSGHTLSMRDENCSGCLWLAFAVCNASLIVPALGANWTHFL